MTVDVIATVVIERPIAHVAASAGDPSNAPDWCHNVLTADWETDPPIALGSRIAFRVRFLGRTMVSTHEVTELTPGEQVALRNVEGPFPVTTTSTWRAIGPDKTHMTLRSHSEPTGLAQLAAPVMARARRRAMHRDLGELKRILERGSVTH